MRMLAAFALVIAALSLNTGSAQAERYWPWCARYSNWTIVCSFATWQQCQETISGVGGYCQQNVMPPPVYEQRMMRTHKRKHRHRY